MARFAEKYARRTGTKFCRDRRVTARVIEGLAKHKVELGAPLCPCRDYDDKEAEVTVCSKAKDYFINSIGNRPVAVVVVCGLYRTGKSYLLNLLSHHHNDSEEPGGADSPAFTVGATVNACTSGIWMWASSISNDKGPVYVLLDCEGSGNVEHDRDHDSILFALGTLLSGYFIYNSKGVIDESAIQTLSVVTSLAQHIQNAQQDEDTSKLLYRTRVVWRRTAAKKVATAERNFATSSAPSQVELLKTKVFRDCAPKTINNVPVTGIMFARLLDQYVHSINSNEIPKVGSVWQALQAQEGERVLGECSNEYRTLVRDRVKPNLPILEAELTASIKAIRLEVYSRFKKESLGEKKVVAQYKEQLKDLMDDVDKEIINSNEVMAREDLIVI
ncbi:interferon-induced guanylate-binding protein, putative [Perkinsus marinus ATCC 50983]|uniref:Interferon-induced guanylate-binding protein, putative n=1 Tax=Perkinsus marinus (strain ATCC 50983 / TXsc) TaxID=423536 RepID=C5LAT9_PERM5|nr:interferon-induced guanylate-binding protein, putative [Perkinsus marinus ATCC 50983]EER06166.1 interferon-induced guanylate-binding protein, putative [Perkinsus marinus ATCC 50983]|eukprot:XP_002774350.1 interferon-induced guanylate-binding protein, putative [Perkinsus marinus ATCC 50983]